MHDAGSYEPQEQLDAAWLDPSNPMAASSKSSGKTLAQLAAERPAAGPEAAAQLQSSPDQPAVPSGRAEAMEEVRSICS